MTFILFKEIKVGIWGGVRLVSECRLGSGELGSHRVPMPTVCVALSSVLGLSVPLGLAVADLLLPASATGLENDRGAQYGRSWVSLEERCCI